MPVTASFPRKYYSTTYQDLTSIPPVAGNIIALTDADGFYYDMVDPNSENNEVVRRKASGIKFISASELSSHQEPETIFVVNTGTSEDEEGNSIELYSGYIWYQEQHVEIFNNSRDFQVKTEVNSSTKAYLVGSISSSTDVGTLIKNTNIYITPTGNKLHANIDGNADTATSATTANRATIATTAEYDDNSTPHKITSYLQDVVSDAQYNLGSTITFTLGNGNVKPIRVSDTTYSVFTSNAAGLVPGTSTTVPSDNTGLLLSGSGWLSTSAIPVDSAVHDGDGNVITATYYASASFNTTTKELTLTKGDGTSTDDISIPYVDSVVSTSAAGLVPTAPSSDASIKFLRGDATWQTITTYHGASSGAAGVSGLVPAASSGDTESFLKSDGTWASPLQNSTGSTDDSSHTLYLVGAQSQASSAQTYSNIKVYSSGGKLYSNNAEVVNLSDTQALTNKTYEGYTLGDACEKTVSTALNGSSPANNLPTNNAVKGYVADAIDSKVDVSLVADIYDDTSTSYAVGNYCMYDDGNGYALYQCNTAITAPAGSFDSTKWDSKLITGLDTWLSGTLTAGQTSLTISNAAIKVGSMLEIYTDVYGLQPTNVAVTTGQVVLTFTAQGVDLNIKVRVI